MATIEAIEARLVKDGLFGHWLWPGALVDGYGNSRVAGLPGTHLVHRLMYERYVGPIPADRELDHLCRTRHCANPVHLEPVTDQVNCLRGEAPSAINARKTVCPKGHPYDTTWSEGNGRRGRRCKTCERERAARKYAANPGYWQDWARRRRERQAVPA